MMPPCTEDAVRRDIGLRAGHQGDGSDGPDEAWRQADRHRRDADHFEFGVAVELARRLEAQNVLRGVVDDLEASGSTILAVKRRCSEDAAKAFRKEWSATKKLIARQLAGAINEAQPLTSSTYLAMVRNRRINTDEMALAVRRTRDLDFFARLDEELALANLRGDEATLVRRFVLARAYLRGDFEEALGAEMSLADKGYRADMTGNLYAIAIVLKALRPLGIAQVLLGVSQSPESTIEEVTGSEGLTHRSERPGKRGERRWRVNQRFFMQQRLAGPSRRVSGSYLMGA
ncbi:MAG: hypothetical protein U1F43_26320 [Myxococcota bacterium]